MDRSPHGLIATKLMLPAGPRHFVHRARLDRLLAAGIRRKLTLIAAPAGFGKTSLATSWLSTSFSRPVGWVSLESKENDPARFWAYVLAALDSIGVPLPPDNDAVERSADEPPEVALASLINCLAVLRTDEVLVLDDYHTITDQRIHQGMAFLIGRLPPRVHLVILTRSDPPFIHSRWKANGDVVEVRARDLAFNRDETDIFMSDNGVDLSAELQEALFGRLSGWVAALRLATTWMSGRSDPSGAVAAFAASDSTIAAYLTSEVLDELPVDLRRFLLWTSVLPRLTGPLCDAVMGSTGGAGTLRYLYGRDLFLDALDPAHEWFGYHQLFAELLNHQLRRDYPELVDVLHRRAAQWYAANGLADEAIEQALAAKDWSGVKLLMLSEVLAIGTRSQPSVVEAWLAQVPADVLATPFFAMLQAFVWVHDGRIAEARQVIDRARFLAANTAAAGLESELPELLPLLHVISAGIARLDCDLVAATEEARAVAETLEAAGATATPLGEMALAAATNSLLGTAFWHGDQPGDDLPLAEPAQPAPELVRMRINRMSLEALALADAGQLREAEAVSATVLDLAQNAGLSRMFQTNPAHLAIGLASLQRVEYDRAHQELTIVWERGRRHGDRAPTTTAGVLLARLAGLTQDIPGALRILDEAKTAWPSWSPPSTVLAIIAEEEARLCIAAGDLAAARVVLGRLEALPERSSRIAFSIQLTAARLRLANGHGGSAPFFSEVASLALANGRLSRGVEALVEAAAAGRAAGDLRDAQATLGRALALAEHETIAAPFVWHAAAVRPLLLSMELGGGELAMLGFRQRLLDAMGVPTRVAAAAQPGGAASDALSERELTVLRLLRGTLTNPQIAAALEISPNTLKTHLRHIYGKLGADNRRLAIVRARELNLL